MFFLDAAVHAFHRLLAVGVWNQLTEGAAVFLAAGMGIERCTGSALGDQILQFARLNAHGTGQFQSIRLTSEPMGQLPRDAPHLGELFADVDRQPDGAGAVVDRAGHPLADPPVGVGGELVSHRRVELIDGPFESDRTLLNQIQQFQSLVLVFLGDADHKAEVGRHHPIPGTFAHADFVTITGGELLFREFLKLLHLLDVVRQFNLFSGCQQRNATDAAEIKTDGIGGQTAALTR